MIGLRPWLLLPIFFIFWPHHVAYETLVLQPGIELLALAASNLSHWATRLAPFTAFKDKLPHYSLADLRQVWGALHQTPWLPLPPHSEEPGECSELPHHSETRGSEASCYMRIGASDDHQEET